MSPKSKEPRVNAPCLRIVLFANLMAMMIYGAIVPHELFRVTAECVTIGVVALAMAVQPYFTASACCSCLPYNVWVAIALDGLCAAGWCAVIALLSYCNIDVVYTPRNGDPDAWFKCYDANNWDTFLTSDGTGKWIKLVWCEVEVNGQNRLIGNDAARQQLRVLLGLAESLLSAREPIVEDSKTRITREELASRNQAAAQREKRDDLWAGTCTAINVVGPGSHAGPQTTVANTQTCSGSPCDFAIGQAISSQYTLTSSTTQTITNSVGVSVDATVGVDLIAEADVTVGASYEFSKAIATETGTSLSTSNTTTVTNTLGQYTGTKAFATFTGTYTCYTFQLDCGSGTSDDMAFCSPSFTGEGSGQTLQGDYNVVYQA